MRHLLWSALPLLALACTESGTSVQPASGSQVSQLRAAGGDGATWLSMDILTVGPDGAPLDCANEPLAVSARVSFDGGGRWVNVRPGSVVKRCSDELPPQVSMVIDNSGSQDEVLDQSVAGALDLTEGVAGLGGRASLVRVSTNASVLSGLTDSFDALSEAIQGMYVNDGWTALYDGLRMGNETLGAALAPVERPEPATLQEFCDNHARAGIVAFTNGEDNNSGGERLTTDGDDGLATTFDDAANLRLGDAQTPIHTIALGPRHERTSLRDLSDATGGSHLALTDPDDIPDAFGLVRSWIESATHVCLEVPQRGCGEAIVEVSWTAGRGRDTWTGSKRQTVQVACPVADPIGATATILLTLNDPGIPTAERDLLVTNTVDYVSPVNGPRVLVVRDDNHHNEDIADTPAIADVLAAAGFDVTFVEEPTEGLQTADVAAYDVVWFANPGWPMDDVATFDTLRAFAATGKGVVLQGDDMAWSMGNAFRLDALTHLTFTGNGTSTCGRTTDNRRGAQLAVDIEGDGHTVSYELDGASWRYGNDIDASVPRDEGERVLAWSELADDPSCRDRRPTVVTWEPPLP